MNRFARAMVIIVILAGCGGGGGEPPAPTVLGVAAAGSPLVGTVTLKDSSSPPKELAMAADFQGAFSFNVSGLTAPFLLRSTGSTVTGNNYTLYSLATNSGNCNINPLTHLAVTMANGGQDPARVFDAPAATQIAAVAAALPNAVASVQDKLAPLFSRVEASPVNFITDQMTANGQGIDLLFDMVSIAITNGDVNIVNTADGGIILPSTSIISGVLSGSADVSMMSPLYSITGHVTKAGTAISGEVVRVTRPTSSHPDISIISTRTDAQGNYKLLVPNGIYKILACPATSYGELCNVKNVTVNNANVTGLDFQ